MQGYAYSIFSAAAIVIHLILNFDLLAGRHGLHLAHVVRYRWFLFGVLAYYTTDAAWGAFAGLRWMVPWYIDTLFFFLSLVAFVFLWCRFAADYLSFGRASRRFWRS